MRRVTVAVAAEPALIRGASHVHVLLGKAGGLETYAEPGWQDAQGNLYCVSSGLWTDTQLAGVSDPAAFADVVADFMARVPGLDPGDIAAAQAAFAVGQPAAAGRIAAVIGEDPPAALALLGLAPLMSGL